MLEKWRVTIQEGSFWSLLFRENMTSTTLRMGSILLLITIWCTRLLRYIKRMKISDAKAAVDGG